MTQVTIYHNPACGTSRNTLALIRNAGVEPTIIEYLKTPPDRATLESLIARLGIRPRDLLREKGTPFAELGLAESHWTDAQLIDQMLKYGSCAINGVAGGLCWDHATAAPRKKITKQVRDRTTVNSPEKNTR